MKKERCVVCPRRCGCNRNEVKGFCGEKQLKVSHVMQHYWEEPLISGDESGCGSGTIFFTGCNLKCVYCQNWEISNNGIGKQISIDELIDIFKKLENAGVNNINLVTPTHFANEIIKALTIYKPKVPVVWNTSGYENPETIEKLKGLVDVFLTDIKYFSTELSNNYSKAQDYFEFASTSIIKMREIVGEDVVCDGLMKKGLIVRHMILPGCSDDSIKIINWINNNLGKDTVISIMNQYWPCYKAKEYPQINKKVSPIEYKRVVNYAISLGFKNVYIQEISSSSDEFIPKFKGDKPFGY